MINQPQRSEIIINGRRGKIIDLFVRNFHPIIKVRFVQPFNGKVVRYYKFHSSGSIIEADNWILKKKPKLSIKKRYKNG